VNELTFHTLGSKPTICNTNLQPSKGTENLNFMEKYKFKNSNFRFKQRRPQNKQIARRCLFAIQITVKEETCEKIMKIGKYR
jgi:hypothetical protein